MGWKYCEPKDEAGNEVDEKRARDLFGVRDSECPSLKLENGWWAVWCSTPRKKPEDYDVLSSKPAEEANAKAFRHVGA